VGVDEDEWPGDLPAVVFTLTALEEGAEPEVIFRERLDPRADPAVRRWRDHEIDLAPWAGGTLRLRFEAVPERDDAGAPFVYPVWGDPTIVAPDPAARRWRNAVLISMDTLRADHLGCYGYSRPTSPVIDTRLAAEGTLFEHAYSAFPTTHGSHMTVLTALPPCVHGIGVFRDALAGDVRTLAEVARAAGYETAAFTEDGVLNVRFGFWRGFGTYVENTGASVDGTTGRADRTFPDALAWIRRHAGAPWLAFVHTYQVHRPYRSPAGYVERVAPDHGDDQGARFAAAYDGALRYGDELLGAFLDGLRSAGVLDQTLIVLFSDHGEQFGERGLFAHSNSLYDELLRVPLIMRAPGLVPAGRRIEAPVGLIDVMPTMLDLLGLPAVEGVRGRSLAPLLEERALPEVPLFAEAPLQHLVSVRRGPYTWILNDRTGELEVLARDGGAERGADETLRAEGVALLREYRALCQAAPDAPAPGVDDLDPAVRDKLRALGYVE
jgi:hypothetical protein